MGEHERQTLSDALTLLRSLQRWCVGISLAVIVASTPSVDDDLQQTKDVLAKLVENRKALNDAFHAYLRPDDPDDPDDPDEADETGSNSAWLESFLKVAVPRFSDQGLSVQAPPPQISLTFPFDDDLWMRPLGRLVGSIRHPYVAAFELDEAELIPDEITRSAPDGDQFVDIGVGVDPMLESRRGELTGMFEAGDVIQGAFVITTAFGPSGRTASWRIDGRVTEHFVSIENIDADEIWDGLASLRSKNTWLDVKALTLDEAVSFIEGRVDEAEDMEQVDLPLPGAGTVEVGAHVVFCMTFSVLAGLLLLMATHLRALMTSKRWTEGARLSRYPWVSLYDGAVAEILTWVAGALLPIAAIVLVALELGDGVASGYVAFAVAALGWLGFDNCRWIRQLRGRVLST